MSYTANLLLSNPVPGDPAVTNLWGTIENTGRSLVDDAVAGTLSLSVAGATNVILTSNQGAADQARHQRFVFSGVLTGNITVFWPASLTSFFSVKNSCTGAFTLTLAVNNGSGSPAGTTTVISQGVELLLQSDGTNIISRATALNVTNGSSGQVYIGQGSSLPPAFKTISGDLTIASLGSAAITAIQGTAVSGTTGSSNVVFANTPSLTGTVSLVALSGSSNASMTGSVTGAAFIPSGTAIPTNGLYLPTANRPSIAVNGVLTQQWLANNSQLNVAGSSNTSYQPYTWSGGSINGNIGAQSTPSVTNISSSVILSMSNTGAFILVSGTDGSGNRFFDLIQTTNVTTLITVVSSMTVAGAPTARTYSKALNSVDIKLAMGSSIPYAVKATSFEGSN